MSNPNICAEWIETTDQWACTSSVLLVIHYRTQIRQKIKT